VISDLRAAQMIPGVGLIANPIPRTAFQAPTYRKGVSFRRLYLPGPPEFQVELVATGLGGAEANTCEPRVESGGIPIRSLVRRSAEPTAQRWTGERRQAWLT